MSPRSADRRCSPGRMPSSTGRKYNFSASPRRRPGSRATDDAVALAFAGMTVSSEPVEGIMPGVLDGIRILDFGRYIAGPFCAALLADIGAEVIRIERIGGGEDRSFIPVGAGPEGGGAMFLAMNRNKRGMTLDPAAPKGREIGRASCRERV